MKELMGALKETDFESMSVMSNTRRFKLIPFTNHLMLVDQVTELLVRQNVFLHQCHAISVINIGDITYRFQAKQKLNKSEAEKGEDQQMVDKDEVVEKEGVVEDNSRDPTPKWGPTEDSFARKLIEEGVDWEEETMPSMFSSWERGKQGQIYFITTKDKKERAEQWIDNMLVFFCNAMEHRLAPRRFRREGRIYFQGGKLG